MHNDLGGVLSTEIYTIEDGFVVIEQADEAAVMLAPYELLVVIRQLHAYYDERERWQEPQPG